jgi:prolyl-tRNA synthetase
MLGRDPYQMLATARMNTTADTAQRPTKTTVKLVSIDTDDDAAVVVVDNDDDDDDIFLSVDLDDTL